MTIKAAKDFNKITQKSKEYCAISVFSKRGFSISSDSETRSYLEQIADKFDGVVDGSGYCLLSKQRDFGFSFPSRKAASKFAAEAYKKGLIKAKVSVCDAYLEWNYGDHQTLDYKKV